MLDKTISNSPPDNSFVKNNGVILKKLKKENVLDIIIIGEESWDRNCHHKNTSYYGNSCLIWKYGILKNQVQNQVYQEIARF